MQYGITERNVPYISQSSRKLILHTNSNKRYEYV